MPDRKPYNQPALTNYGQLKDLTTGGSGSAQEPSSGKKPRP
jgi:hypothetical protein